MPSYFYHISLELLPFSGSSLSRASPDFDRKNCASLAFESAGEALLPFQKRGHSKLPVRGGRGRAGDKTPTSVGNATTSAFQEDKNQCLVPGASSPSQTTDSAITAKNISHLQSTTPASVIESDPRFDKISIESIDMIAPEQTTPQSKRAEKHNEGNNAITTGIGTDILGGLHTKGRYIPLDQKLSDSVWGIVHLYRDAKETPSLMVDDYPPDLKGFSAARQPTDQLGDGGKHRSDGSAAGNTSPSLPDEDCTTLCILAVPSYLSPSDFLGFVGEETRDHVSHFRMIRTARANRYMVLMKFRSGKKAREWQKEWNGKVFNSMEVCQILNFLCLSPRAVYQLTLSARNLPCSICEISRDPRRPQFELIRRRRRIFCSQFYEIVCLPLCEAASAADALPDRAAYLSSLSRADG